MPSQAKNLCTDLCAELRASRGGAVSAVGVRHRGERRPVTPLSPFVSYAGYPGDNSDPAGRIPNRRVPRFRGIVAPSTPATSAATPAAC